MMMSTMPAAEEMAIEKVRWICMFITICTRLLFSSCKLCSSFWLMATPLVHAPTDKKLIYCLHIHIKCAGTYLCNLFQHIWLKYWYAIYATYLLYIQCVSRCLVLFGFWLHRIVECKWPREFSVDVELRSVWNFLKFSVRKNDMYIAFDVFG